MEIQPKVVRELISSQGEALREALNRFVNEPDTNAVTLKKQGNGPDIVLERVHPKG